MSKLTGAKLIDCLKRTPGPVAWLRPGLPPLDIHSSVAIAIVGADPHIGKLSSAGKVRYIEAIDTREAEWEKCWRNSEAAVCQPNAVSGRYFFEAR